MPLKHASLHAPPGLRPISSSGLSTGQETSGMLAAIDVGVGKEEKDEEGDDDDDLFRCGQ